MKKTISLNNPLRRVMPLAFFLVTGTFSSLVWTATEMGPEFTYQGRLSENSTPANGSYDFEFRLYDAADQGLQVGATIFLEAVMVTDGLFSVKLDFGSDVFTGNATWIGIDVRPVGSMDFVTLSPRALITPAPYAQFALNGLNGPAGVAGPQGPPGTQGPPGDTHWTGSGNSIYFDGGGNVGIGTATPTEKLEVIGNIRLSGSIVSSGDICIGNCGL